MTDQDSSAPVTRDQAEEAVRTLLRWAGEDPAREGLLDTPKRVAEAYGDWFSGYREDPRAYLERTFEEVAGYDEMIVLRDIEYESHCEHHMAPIIGRVHVGYLPDGKVVGISKLARVVNAYTEWYSGYELDPDEYLERTFKEVAGYDEMIVLRDIEFESHCEHHMAPIIGRVHVGYLPDGKVVGISKLARVVEAYAKRFQVQEKMTAQIANCIQRALHPLGVGVVVDGSHECMTTRGVHKRGVSMLTSQMLGDFREDARTRAEFMQLIRGGRGG